MKQFWDYMESISSVYYNEIYTKKTENGTLDSIQMLLEGLNNKTMNADQKKVFNILNAELKEAIANKNEIIKYQNDLGISELFGDKKKLQTISGINDPKMQDKWEASYECEKFSRYNDGKQKELYEKFNNTKKEKYQELIKLIAGSDTNIVRIKNELERLIK